MPQRTVTFGVNPGSFGPRQDIDNSHYRYGPPLGTDPNDLTADRSRRDPPGQDHQRPSGNGDDDDPEDEDGDDDDDDGEDDDDDDFDEDEEEEEEGCEEEELTDDECVIPDEIPTQEGEPSSRRDGSSSGWRERSPRRTTSSVPAPPPPCAICGNLHDTDVCPHRCAICGGGHRTEQHEGPFPTWFSAYWQSPVIDQLTGAYTQASPASPQSGGYQQQQQQASSSSTQQQQQHPQHPTANNAGSNTTQQTQRQSETTRTGKAKAASRAKSLSTLKPEKEEKYVRVRDVKDIKTHNLPTDSANVRGWKAVNIPVWNSYDVSAEGFLSTFIDQGIRARGRALEKLKYQDGKTACPFPRFNRAWGASFMTSANLRHPELGEQLQQYSEECQRGNYPISRQYCVGLVCKYFDVEKSRGAVMSEVQLLGLTLSGHGIDAPEGPSVAAH